MHILNYDLMLSSTLQSAVQLMWMTVCSLSGLCRSIAKCTWFVETLKTGLNFPKLNTR